MTRVEKQLSKPLIGFRSHRLHESWEKYIGEIVLNSLHAGHIALCPPAGSFHVYRMAMLVCTRGGIEDPLHESQAHLTSEPPSPFYFP